MLGGGGYARLPPRGGGEQLCCQWHDDGVSNYIHHKVWDEITYPCANFNGATVDIREWICNVHVTLYLVYHYLSVPRLSHWCRDKMAVIFQTTSLNAFSWMKMYELRLRFHWSLFLSVELTLFHQWFRLWLGAGSATSHCLNQCWLVHRRIYASLGLNESLNVR